MKWWPYYECGFCHREYDVFHKQCPNCKVWGSMQPRQGADVPPSDANIL